MTVEIPRHGNIQVDISYNIFGLVCSYVRHVGILADKDLGSNMVVWQWMFFDNLTWWTYLTLSFQIEIWVVNVVSILEIHSKIFFPFFGSSITLSPLLAFLLSRQGKLLHVCKQNIGFIFWSKVARITKTMALNDLQMARI
jgi:hypothetical protein